MISRIQGTLESIDGLDATVRLDGSGLSYQVLVPLFFAERLRDHAGRPITLHTIEYLEGQGPGGAFVPRLIGFATAAERRFFELLTTVDGMGNKKALRALAQEPAQIARAIAGGNAPWLTQLPEIGKKTAEKVILELKDKVQPFLTAAEVAGLDTAARAPARASDPASAAVGALVALGETRTDAERMVRDAMAANPALAKPDEIVQAAFAP